MKEDVKATIELVEEFDDVFNPVDPNKKAEQFRNYAAGPRYHRVKKFYSTNHKQQTLEFVQNQKKEMCKWNGGKMTILEAFHYLDNVVDESDPDTCLSQLDHGLQTAEAIRKEHPELDWMVFTGLIHDLGKVLCKPEFGLEQWAIVGDTFPVGCKFSDKIVFSELFEANPDSHNEKTSTSLGIYEPNCGLMKVHFSFGHDEYMYQVLTHNNTTLPEPALYMIRFHSFYSWHRENEYSHLTNEKDKEMLEWVKKFNKFDLYSKSDERPKWDDLRSYYIDLIDKFAPGTLSW